MDAWVVGPKGKAFIRVSEEQAVITAEGGSEHIPFFAEMRVEGDELAHTEDTLKKVYAALEELGMDPATSIDVVSAITNKGVLFRERA